MNNNNNSESITRKPIGEEGNDTLSDNKVKVAIDPDVNANKVYIQICSCSLLLNCFTK